MRADVIDHLIELASQLKLRNPSFLAGKGFNSWFLMRYNPQLAHTVMKGIAETNIPLPPYIDEPVLRRFYIFCQWDGIAGYYDRELQMVEELAVVTECKAAQLIRPLLLCKDAEIDEIAELISVPAAVVELFEALHFSVRDRLDEKTFIGHLLFGVDSRCAEFNSDHVTALNTDRLLLRAAVECGKEEVFYLAGVRHDDPEVSGSVHDLEKQALRTSRRLARNGYLNASKVNAFTNAKNFAAAAAQKDMAAGDQPETPRICGVAFADAMSKELMALAGEKNRAILEQQSREFDAEYKKDPKAWLAKKNKEYATPGDPVEDAAWLKSITEPKQNL